MVLHLVCPGCARSLQAPDEVAGKSLQCPSCRHVFIAPAGVVDAEAVGGEGITTTPTQPVRHHGDGNREQIVQRTAGDEQERRPCPLCGEMIVAQAAKCRFCGEIFDPELRRLAKRKARREREADVDVDMTAGDWVLAVLCTDIACLLGLVWLIQGKPKAGKMVGVALLILVVKVIVVLAITGMQEAIKG